MFWGYTNFYVLHRAVFQSKDRLDWSTPIKVISFPLQMAYSQSMGLKTKWGISLAITTPNALWTKRSCICVTHAVIEPLGHDGNRWMGRWRIYLNQPNWDTAFFFPYIRKPILSVWATCFFFLTFSFQKLKYLNDLTQLTTLKDLLCIY